MLSKSASGYSSYCSLRFLLTCKQKTLSRTDLELVLMKSFVKTRRKNNTCQLLSNLNQLMLFLSYRGKSVRTKKLHFKAYLCCSLLLPVPHHATCRDSCKQIKAQRNLNFVDIPNALILSNLFQESHHLLNNWQLPVNLLRAVTVLICHNWRGPPASGLISQMCWWLRYNRYILSPPWLLLFLDAAKVEINVIYSWRSCAPMPALGCLHILQRLLATVSPVCFVFLSWSCS